MSRSIPQHYGLYSIFYDARVDVRGRKIRKRRGKTQLDRPVLAKNQNGEVAAQFSSAVSLVLFCCSSPSSSVLPSLSSCSVVRRRPVQFGRLSRLVLLFVAVQFSSAVSRLVRLSVEYSGKSELEQQWLIRMPIRDDIHVYHT